MPCITNRRNYKVCGLYFYCQFIFLLESNNTLHLRTSKIKLHETKRLRSWGKFCYKLQKHKKGGEFKLQLDIFNVEQKMNLYLQG